MITVLADVDICGRMLAKDIPPAPETDAEHDSQFVRLEISPSDRRCRRLLSGGSKHKIYFLILFYFNAKRRKGGSRGTRRSAVRPLLVEFGTNAFRCSFELFGNIYINLNIFPQPIKRRPLTPPHPISEMLITKGC